MRIAKLRDELQTALWVAPTVGAAGALALAIGLLAIDRTISQDHAAWYLFDGGPDAAQHLLSVITASMLTFTALVFSITVLVLQLASTQFSPRVIRTFLHDRTTKWTMAAFVGTFVYAIAVLSQVRTGPPPFVPGLATWIGLVLVIGSIGVFIHYIHRMAHAVRAVSMIESVARETRDGIERLYPDSVGGPSTVDELAPAEPPARVVCHRGAPGVVAAVDIEELFATACDHDLVIEVVPRLGDFVPTGAMLLRIWGSGDHEIDEEIVTLEDERSPYQDPGCGFRQLVDIALRALSPAVNDPTTAVQALDQLHDLLRRLTQREFPRRARADSEGRLRLIVARPALEDYVMLATEEIASAGAGSIRIMRRLEAMLKDCSAIAAPDTRAMLEAHQALFAANRKPR